MLAGCMLPSFAAAISVGNKCNAVCRKIRCRELYVAQFCYDERLSVGSERNAVYRFEQMLEPVMLEVKKLRTLQRKGNEMGKHKVLEKTRKYLVRCSAIVLEPVSARWVRD